MTNEEAIERLVCDKFILLCAAKHPDEVNLDEINIAKAAIEKQIPKKMEKKKCVCYDGEEQEYEVCTDCGVQVKFAGTMTAKYCWNCGQRVL